jgi:hypothetical protein
VLSRSGWLTRSNDIVSVKRHRVSQFFDYTGIAGLTLRLGAVPRCPFVVELQGPWKRNDMCAKYPDEICLQIGLPVSRTPSSRFSIVARNWHHQVVVEQNVRHKRLCS